MLNNKKMKLEKLNVIELDNTEIRQIEGGYFLETMAAIAVAATSYEFGYQYAKRHLANEG